MLSARAFIRHFTCGKVEGDVGEHVLLAADEGPPAGLDEEPSRVDPVRGGGAFGVAQEAGVDPGVSEGERFAVDLHRTGL